MTIILIFIAVIAAVVGWWLSTQRLMSKPWLEVGVAPAASESSATPAAKIGLGVFLAVVGALFALFGSAFVMRMDYADWQQVPLPPVIWLNTALLMLSSVFLHFAVVATRNGDARALQTYLALGGISAFGFLAGQLLAWNALSADGHLLAANPANSFFYLITGLHGLHILGGLVGLGRIWTRFAGGIAPQRLRTGVGLLATYWHFLLGVWIAIIALLLGWANDFVAMCSAAFT